MNKFIASIMILVSLILLLSDIIDNDETVKYYISLFIIKLTGLLIGHIGIKLLTSKKSYK